ncbi:MAG: malectin domain-containing carbohydrate-binding protein [Candidatus Saccharibacteria bacterium]|nr:malectin domain-containing carbohydrate-binding protein [Candidatus Saccharibacteria bacterium]
MAGKVNVDNEGNQWEADQYFTNGSCSNDTYSVSNDIANTPDDELYQSERFCMESYDIPLADGDYTLNLHFAEIYPDAAPRVFGVTAEGDTLFTDYNIAAEVGDYTATTRSFDVTVNDGTLNLAFQRGTENPKISAIEVVEQADEEPDPEPDPEPEPEPEPDPNPSVVSIPFRLNAGGGTYTDVNGNQWQADEYYTHSDCGKDYSVSDGIANTEDDTPLSDRKMVHGQLRHTGEQR